MMTRRTAAGMAIAAFVLGGFATHYMAPVYAQGDVKAPTWKYGLNTRVRRGDEKSFDANTKKVGLEVYKDENNGNWIYISETGSIAVVPGK